MSGDVAELARERRAWVDTTRRNNFEKGINRLLTELYPDNAHFIYELLENAEDAEATVVRFTLHGRGLDFEHNGSRLFTFADVESITSIGDSTKSNDATSIGKFGIGFKAVFAYTDTPEVHSGDYHFRIVDLVVPETKAAARRSRGMQTLFLFPFNHAKKPADRAVVEVEHALGCLAENSLLFLRNIRKIEYMLQDGSLGLLECVEHEDGRIVIRAMHPDGSDVTTHWLRFQKDVEVEDEGEQKACRAAVAYRLEEEEVTGKRKRSQRYRIVPMEHGQVCIYFPAEKEVSNLRFHLHAPFASTVARDSVRDCPGNDEIRNRLADLVVESLTHIRDQSMLSVSFLAILPNPADNLPVFYEPIREAIVHAFQNDALTPTKSGMHAASAALYRGPARISEVVEDDDLALLTDYEAPLWVANPPQQNQREDRFLDSLAIDSWGWGSLVSAVGCSHTTSVEKRSHIEQWIRGKADAWLQRFYALLDEAQRSYYLSIDVSKVRIVRVEGEPDHEHVIPSEACFPPDDESVPPSDVRLVKPTVYTSGRSAPQKEAARSFLEHAGVREYDLKFEIERKLATYKRGSRCADAAHYDDVRQFVAYLKKNPGEVSLFNGSRFLLSLRDGKLHWRMPNELILDLPPLAGTGLADSACAAIHGRQAVWDGYLEKLGTQVRENFVAFLRAVGVMYCLQVTRCSVDGNPQAVALKQDYCGYRVRYTDSAVNDDYTIEGLGWSYSIEGLGSYSVFNFNPSIPNSRLVWDALIRADKKCAKARFRPNQQYPLREEDSQLVHLLKNNAWVPDRSDSFRTPREMTREDLRADFPYDDRNGLLTAIGFGEHAKLRDAEYQVRDAMARTVGFGSAEEAADWAELARAGLTPSQVLSLVRQSSPIAQPEESVANPDRRRRGVLELGENAPDRISVQRERSIQPGVKPVVAEAKAYLRPKYTNEDGQMVCQACRDVMPFMLPSGEYYFEAIQCVSGLEKHYFQNRLALCPTCSAMYQFARRDTDDELKEAIAGCEVEPGDAVFELEIVLAGKPRTLRFVATHFLDLQTILRKAT